MSVKESGLKFTHLYHETLELVSNMRARMKTFVSNISNNMVIECKETILNNKMDISMLIVYVYKIEEEKWKQVEAKEW